MLHRCASAHVLSASGTWRMTNATLSKGQTLPNSCLCRLHCTHCPEKITNEDLWKRLQQGSVATQFMRRKWEFDRPHPQEACQQPTRQDFAEEDPETQSAGTLRQKCREAVTPGRTRSLLVGCLTSQQHASVSQGRGRTRLLLVGCLTSQQHASVSQGRARTRLLLIDCLTSQQHASVSHGRGRPWLSIGCFMSQHHASVSQGWGRTRRGQLRVECAGGVSSFA